MTDTAARNIAAVQDIYAAFGRGDVPAILDRLAEDVEWDAWSDNHGQDAGVPWLQRRSGREAVRGFFDYIGAWKTNGFEIRNLMAGGDSVAADVMFDFDVTQTGARLREEEIHLWSFDDAGQVSRYRHYSDTAKHIAAAKGEGR